MELLLSVVGLVIAAWLLGRGDWNAYRPQLAVAWIVVGTIGLWMAAGMLRGWLG